MKNLMFVFIAATTLAFTSCSKENLELPAAEIMEAPVAQKMTTQTTTPPQALQTQPNVVTTAKLVTIQLQVTELMSYQTTTEYSVDFTGNYDFTNLTLKNLQSLKFTDANNQESRLDFEINNYTGSNGTLQVVFAKRTHVLTGLSLVTAQEIIIEDNIII